RRKRGAVVVACPLPLLLISLSSRLSLSRPVVLPRPPAPGNDPGGCCKWVDAAGGGGSPRLALVHDDARQPSLGAKRPLGDIEPVLRVLGVMLNHDCRAGRVVVGTNPE